VEQHGENPRQNVYAIIPARHASTRLAGKLLLDLAGKPLILHTLEQAKKAKNIDRVIVATDSEEILEIVKESGNEAVLTSENHQSGSDRIAEIAANLPENSIIVNVQGDEPLIPPCTIEKAVEAILENENADIATTCEKIEDFRDVLSSDVVKVVTDKNGYALYFSRSPIPFPREAVKKHGSLENALRAEKDLLALFRKHTGLYVYRREFLLKFTLLEQTHLEKTEMLEQLRALENGAKIKVVEVAESSIGVDTAEDFERARKIIEGAKNFNIRRATLEDVPQIAEVHVESWKKSFEDLVPREYLENLSPEKREKSFRENFAQRDYEIFVAETPEKKIVGFADFGKGESFPEYDRELYAIYFLKEFQRRGIGGELFKTAAKNLYDTGFRSLYLQALKISPYREFYEKLGGEIIGQGVYRLGEKDFETVFYGWNDLSVI
jgi:3-deoxy-manno-octulosonate cytidylyltransferase (CMP-KDO synthetase)